MQHGPLEGLPRGKEAGIYAIRKLSLATTIWLAGIASAAAASPHYSLPYTFPAQSTGTGIRNPQAIILGQDGVLHGVGTGGGYFGLGGVFTTRDGKWISTAIDFDSSGADPTAIGALIPPELPTNNFNPLALLPDDSVVVVTNVGGHSLPNDLPTDVAPQGMAVRLWDSGASSNLHAFFPDPAGLTRPRDVAVGSDGNLYGLAAGTNTRGMTLTTSNLFRVPLGGGISDVFDFTSYSPTNFVLGAHDDMYVSLPKGVVLKETGNASAGDVIYKVTKYGQGSVVHVLDPATEGSAVDELIADSQGNLFGSARSGGPLGNGDGTVFRISAAGEFSVLHSFSSYAPLSAQGFVPNSLVAGSDGNVYGMTRLGGSSSEFAGTLFRIAPSGAYTVLHTVVPQTDGSTARSLIQTGPRTFSGVVNGGPILTGAIFKLVVPIQDDVNGSGKSSLLLSGPGALSVGSSTEIGAARPIADGYFPVTVGDLNGDGIADIVWSSAKHDLYVWFGGVDGFTAEYAGTYPAGWKVIGSGDVNGDGKDDLIWTNEGSHQFAYWLMDGASRIGSRTISTTPGYYPAALGDFDGNGRMDIIWTSAKHDLYAWLGSDSGFSSKYMTTYPAGWQISGRGDLDGDGRDDLVWSTQDGRSWGYWLLNGAAITRIDAYSVPAELAGFSIATSSDINGDGRADITWSNGSQAVQWSNQGQCSATSACTFVASPALSLPANETIFNSGIPAGVNPSP